MKDIIATWICVDTADTGTYFPSAKGKSSDTKIQDIYWRCICCFYTMARYHNPQATLVLFSNTAHLPTVEGTAVKAILQRLSVVFYTTPFEYITPEGYYNQWRNQFYEFSVFKFISQCADFNDDDNFLLLDSDCIITSNLSNLFKEISRERCITYSIDYDASHSINGNSRKDMQAIFGTLLRTPVQQVPQYHAGEFYGSTVAVVKTIINDFYTVWQQLMALHEAGQPKLHEEAHVLSYLFYKNGFSGGQANRYIKRLWTDPTSYRNVEAEDVDLAIWHLPAEKRFGFRQLFEWLQKHGFKIDTIKPQQVKQRLQHTFLIPVIPLQRKPYFAGKYLVKKMFA